jgi:hypothetical protein
MSAVPAWILYHDALLNRRSFAGPFAYSPEVEIDANRLRKAGHSDVETVRARSVARWMPVLSLGVGLTGAQVRKADDILRVIAGWDAVERAFPGQFVEAVASDDEEFRGEVTGVDVAGCFIWICVD